jgi:DNA-binding transcriptional regulator GbsR (MarR family)
MSGEQIRGWQFLNEFFKHIEKIVILPSRITRYEAKKRREIQRLDELVSKLEKKQNKNLNSKTIDKVITQLYARNDPVMIDTLLTQEGINVKNSTIIQQIKTKLLPKQTNT